MRMVGRLAVLSAGVAFAGINWKMVWLQPQGPVLLASGATQAYTVMGLSGGDTTADLTKSPHLGIESSDPDVIAIDTRSGVFIGKRPGHAHLLISFSERRTMFPAFVRERGSASADRVDGVWKAVFTGDMGSRPKMVSEILFDLNTDGKALHGTVHAAYWPGDAPISDGRIDGDRVSFTMAGQSPFQANGVTGYPKLCFTGVRAGAEMRIRLLWSEARRSCEDGQPHPMSATRVPD